MADSFGFFGCKEAKRDTGKPLRRRGSVSGQQANIPQTQAFQSRPGGKFKGAANSTPLQEDRRGDSPAQANPDGRAQGRGRQEAGGNTAPEGSRRDGWHAKRADKPPHRPKWHGKSITEGKNAAGLLDGFNRKIYMRNVTMLFYCV